MDDLISRSAVIGVLEECNYDRELFDKELFDKIEAMVPIEAEPVVHGEWEVVPGVMTPGGDPLLRCPFCKSKESHHMGGIEFPKDWDYCPKCGAKMKGGME